MSSATVFLDELRVIDAAVASGTVGLNGQLGIKGKPVRVGGQAVRRSIAAAAPSRLSFYLGKRFSKLVCSVAMNDDTVWDNVAGSFKVLGDGKELASVDSVRAKSGAIPLTVRTAGVSHLQLVTHASGARFPHTVWVAPQLTYSRSIPAAERVPPDPPVPAGSHDGGAAFRGGLPGGPAEQHGGWTRSVFGQVLIGRPPQRVSSRRCIVTVASAGFSGMLEGFLNTLLAHGCVPDATVIVLNVNQDEECSRVAETYGAFTVPCTSDLPPSMVYKTAMYSVARIVDSGQILCIDADTLVVGDLRPLFYAITACPPDRLFVCREMNDRVRNLYEAFEQIYMGCAAEWTGIGATDEDARSRLIINSGVLAGSRCAMLALDSCLRSLPNYAQEWERASACVTWREQFLVNLVLARSGLAVELDRSYNVQLLERDVEVEEREPYRRAMIDGCQANIVHFNGPSRHKYPALSERFVVKFT